MFTCQMYDLHYLCARLLRGGYNGVFSFSNGVAPDAVNGRRQMVRHDSDTLTNKDIASYMTSKLVDIIVARSTYPNT